MDETISWLTAWLTLANFKIASATLFAWLSGNNDDAEDGDVAEAHEFVLSALSDADQAEKIKLITGKDLRESLTVEEVLEIHKEMSLRHMGGQRN